MEKPECSYTLLEILYFYDLEKSETFGVPNWIFQNTKKELLLCQENRDEWNR